MTCTISFKPSLLPLDLDDDDDNDDEGEEDDEGNDDAGAAGEEEESTIISEEDNEDEESAKADRCGSSRLVFDFLTVRSLREKCECSRFFDFLESSAHPTDRDLRSQQIQHGDNHNN